MKTILVALNATYNHTNLAVRYLERYFNDKHGSKATYSLYVREFSINDDEENVLDTLIREKGDIYAFSCYVWNIRYILDITSDLKKVMPDIRIILGGPEVMYEDHLFYEVNKQIDVIIRGQGEKVLAKLICGDIPMSRFIEGETLSISSRPFIYDGISVFDDNKQYYYETASGCPFSCTYCLSGAYTKVDPLPAERVIREVDAFISGKVRIIKLVDRTFNFDDRRAYEIWSHIIKRYNEKPFNTVFHFEISADLLSDKTLKLLESAPAGIFRFECGVQSVNGSVLENVRRRSDISRILENVKKLVSSGNIEIHVDLIAGLPEENIVSIANSYNAVYDSGVSMVQLGFLKVLKGSVIRDEAERFGLVYSDMAPYKILSTSHLSFEELGLLRRIARMTEIYHNSGNYIGSLRYISKEAFDNDHFGMFRALADEYETRGGFKRAFSAKENLLVLLEAGRNTLKQNARFSDHVFQMFRDLLKFDKYRYDARSEISELKMNMSSRHPDLSEDITSEIRRTLNKVKTGRMRCERYIFDVEYYMETGVIRSGDHFVFYDVSLPKPRILGSAKI